MRYLYVIPALFLLSIHPANLAAQLYIQEGASFSCSINTMICLENIDLTNYGSMNLQAGNGRFIFTGNSNNYISGNTPCVFDELDIEKTGSSLLLNQDITVISSIQFLGGLIDLNGKNISLQQPTTYLGNENESSRITGLSGGNVSIRNLSVNAPALYNIGNLGAAITSTKNLGAMTISRSHVPATAGTSSGIQRVFYIAPSNNNALSATLRFYYFDAELNGKDKNSLALWKSTDGNTWSFVGVDNNDITDNYVEKTAINDFSYWTLSDASDPLPLTLISFSATCQNNYALLQWQTGIEQNTKMFIIERSSDGQSWKDEGTLAATNSSQGSSYSWNDTSPSDHDYYRLEIVNIDGSFSYSPVFAGGCDDVSMPFTVYPNPAETEATVRISVRQDIKAELRLLDISGQVLEIRDWYLQTGVNTYNLSDIERLAAGTYIVQLVYKGNVLQQKLVKK